MRAKSLTTPEWRRLSATDMARVQLISERVHPTLPERQDVLAEKRDLFPEGCLGFAQDEIEGYGLAHPWVFGEIPPLDDFLGALPRDPDCLYIHDVALLPPVRGFGGASRYIALMEALARARNIPWLACVAVYGADRLWAALGFREFANGSLRPKLRSYGNQARYMARSV